MRYTVDSSVRMSLTCQESVILQDASPKLGTQRFGNIFTLLLGENDAAKVPIHAVIIVK